MRRETNVAISVCGANIRTMSYDNFLKRLYWLCNSHVMSLLPRKKLHKTTFLLFYHTICLPSSSLTNPFSLVKVICINLRRDFQKTELLLKKIELLLFSSPLSLCVSQISLYPVTFFKDKPRIMVYLPHLSIFFAFLWFKVLPIIYKWVFWFHLITSKSSAWQGVENKWVQIWPLVLPSHK